MTSQDIIKIVSEETGISVNSIINPSRKSEVALARHISMWACRWNTKESLPKIAAAHNRKQHGSVIHGANNIDSRISIRKRSYDPEIAGICAAILKRINN